MDRNIVYSGSIPLDSDLLGPQQRMMVALGFLIQAVLNSPQTYVSGLTVGPTVPASLSVVVGPGSIIAPQVVEVTPYGSLPSDNDPLVKMGINLKPVTFPITAPTLPGQSQNYLIQCAFSEADTNPVVLSYYNSANPAQPFTGPGNSGVSQNSLRAQTVNLELKAGAPANAGTQITPAPDAGFLGLAIITVNTGQVQITAAAITPYPNVPTLAGLLNSHHGGVPGQAPKVILTAGQEVQGVLPVANGGTGLTSGFARYQRILPGQNGANQAMNVGDTTTITFTAQTNVTLGVQTVNGGVYRLTFVATTGDPTNNDVLFYPNDTGLNSNSWTLTGSDTNAFSAPYIGAPAISSYSALPYLVFDLFVGPNVGGDNINDRGPFIIEATVCTATAAKTVRATSGTAGGGSASFGISTDTTTAWTSLGSFKLNASSPLTGVAVVERIA